MTADLLTLNSSKTEFLLIGNRQQLTKIQNTSLDTAHSARNLGFVFDEHLTLSLTKSLHCLKLVIATFVNFVASVLILILKQLVPLPPQLLTLSLITATPSTSISLSLRKTVSSSFRIILLVLLLKLSNHVTSHLYLNLCIGSKLMNELITSYSLLYTKFS